MERLDTMGERLAAARKARKLSRPELAKACELTRAAIQQWENGTVKGVRPQNLIRVCEVLEIEVRWLVTGEGPRNTKLPADKRKYAERWAAALERLDVGQIAAMLPMLEATIKAQEAGELVPANVEE